MSETGNVVFQIEQRETRRDYAAVLIAEGHRAEKCPWCGTLPSIFSGCVFRRSGFFATCENSTCLVKVVTWPRETPEEALEDWNYRALKAA